jgi:type IV pilus assembly protein PilQ
VIHLKSDGALEAAETFTLDDPARLVVDLPGMKSSVAKERIDVSSGHVNRVRVGGHADKVRVVLDGGDVTDPFQGRRVMPVASGLLVALGSGPAVDAAVAAASASMPTSLASNDEPMEPMDATEPASDGWETTSEVPASADAFAGSDEAPKETASTHSGDTLIYGVEYDSQGDRDRVVVLSEHPVDYLVYEPDSETVVLSLESASLSPDAAVRITPEPGGPVSLVTAYEQPEVDRPEVRVVVKRAPGLKPEVTRRGSLVVLDFARSGGMAASPPILGAEGQIVVQGAGSDAPLIDIGSGTQTAANPGSASSLAPPAAVAPSMAPVDGMPGAPPAGLDPPAAIAILNEGGLMDGKEYGGRRISLDFKEVDIADVLRLIAEVSDLNVIAGDEVKGKVTIRLVDVPWDQALDVVLLTKGLGFVRIGNVQRLESSHGIAQEVELRLQERRAKEKLEDLVV